MLDDAEKAASVAQRLGRKLKPPPSEDPMVTAWRWFIVTVVTINTVTLAGFILITCGLTPLSAGFARASDVNTQISQSINDAMNNKRLKELPSLLLDAKQKQCMANGQAKRLYYTAYNELRAEYYQLAKREFPDPACTDFQ